MDLTLTVNDADETLRTAAQVVSRTARWKIAAAAIRAWVDATPAEQIVQRHTRLVQALSDYQRRELAKRYGLAWDAPAALVCGYFTRMPGPKRPALMAAAVLWAQQEAQGPDGIDHLLDQVIPTLPPERLGQLADEVLSIYAQDFAGSLN